MDESSGFLFKVSTPAECDQFEISKIEQSEHRTRIILRVLMRNYNLVSCNNTIDVI
jgi:hypothetical protein